MNLSSFYEEADEDATECPRRFSGSAWVADQMLRGDFRLNSTRMLRHCDFVWDFYHTVFEGFGDAFTVGAGEDPFPIFVRVLNACMLQVMRMDGQWRRSNAGLKNPTEKERREMGRRRKKWEHDRSALDEVDGKRCMWDARDALHFLLRPDYCEPALSALQIPAVPPHPFADLLQ